jgi:DNA polymerase-1
MLVKLLSFVPIKQIYVGECEADDVIGYLVKNRLKEKKVVIVSSDKDYYQLLSENTTQWSPGQKKFVTENLVLEKFGINVVNFCTARSIIGDPSDNIGGVKGAGFKTLSKRFPELSKAEFVSVDDIIKLAELRGESSKLKIFERITSNSELIRRNWKLMHLDTSNLSATHVEKISSVFNTSAFNRNKIGLMRLLMQEGLSTFDVDSFYMALTASLEAR